MARPSSTPTLIDAVTGLPRVSSGAWRRMGWLRRYLISVRAATLSLTLSACLFGGLLALPWTPTEGGRLIVVSAALTLAHAAGSLINDLLDWALRLDRDDCFRLRHGPLPLSQGLMHPLAHGVLLAITGTAAALLGLVVCRESGAPAYVLGLVGALLLAGYPWPLKRFALGEAAVLLVWGPLMVGGVYWVVSGDWGPEIAALSLVFGLGPAVAVLGKHADERRDDEARGVRTLAVVLGQPGGPRLMAALGLLQVGGGLLWVYLTGAWAYLTLLVAVPALVTLLRVGLRRRPSARPGDYSAELWPLWYSVAGFRFARAAAIALVAGALLDGI